MAERLENVEVVWNNDQTIVLSFIVNGFELTPEEFQERHALILGEELKEPLHEITDIEKLRLLEEMYPDFKSLRNKFDSLLEIIEIRMKLIHKNYCQ